MFPSKLETIQKLNLIDSKLNKISQKSIVFLPSSDKFRVLVRKNVELIRSCYTFSKSKCKYYSVCNTFYLVFRKASKNHVVRVRRINNLQNYHFFNIFKSFLNDLPLTCP